MCVVDVNKLKDKNGAIIYNQVFSQKNSFTIDDIFEDLHKIAPQITKKQIEVEINSYLHSGLLNQHLYNFSVCKGRIKLAI